MNGEFIVIAIFTGSGIFLIQPLEPSAHVCIQFREIVHTSHESTEKYINVDPREKPRQKRNIKTEITCSREDNSGLESKQVENEVHNMFL